MNQGDGRGITRSLVTEERSGVDLIDDQIEAAPTCALVPAPRGVVDAQTSPAAPDDLDVVDDHPVGFPWNGGRKLCDRMSSACPTLQELMGVHLSPAARGMGSVSPVAGQQSHQITDQRRSLPRPDQPLSLVEAGELVGAVTSSRRRKSPVRKSEQQR